MVMISVIFWSRYKGDKYVYLSFDGLKQLKYVFIKYHTMYVKYDHMN